METDVRSKAIQTIKSILLLAGAFTFAFLLWQKRKPLLLPLLMWGAVSMVQEGVTFSLGFLTPGGDAEWIAAMGIPAVLILITGILCILAGVVAITLLLPLAGVEGDSAYWKRLLVVLLGMGSFMLLRSIHSFLASPESTAENLVPFIFSLLLAVIVSLLDKPVSEYTRREFSLTTRPVTWPLSAWALALGATIFLFQVIV